MVDTTWTQTAGMTSETGTDNVEDYAEQAEASKDAAAASETAAASSASAAAGSATAAQTAKTAAELAETNAANSATTAASQASIATTKASEASASESAAAASASAAAASEAGVDADRVAAQAAASAAATSQTNAATSAANASTSETNAANSATASASNATASVNSASAASASETAAATSETNAATSETNAATSETNAAISETNAASSATAAASSATSASNAQTAAESARDATLAAYDNFDDRYLGSKASDPTVDNDGNPLVAGSIYFNSVSGAMRVYTGSAWVAAYVNGADYLALSGGTMTGDVAYGDNVKATFGAGGDLRIFHDGSNSYIQDTGTGNLKIYATNLELRNLSGTETYANFTQDGAAEIYYDNAKKLETTSTGVSVTGSVELNGWTITESGGSLYFATGGTNKMKLDASGNLDVVGSVNSNATIS